MYRVLSELILRGHSPYIPIADDHGVDILLPTGIRIQVKTANLITRKLKHQRGVTESTRYRLSLGWTRVGAKQKAVKRKRKYSDECDYFVIFGVQENRFWIVPSFIMDNRTRLDLGTRPTVSSEQVKAMLDSGKGVLETAAALGVSRGTVWYRKHGDLKRGSWTRAVRQCEDQWEFLNTPPADLAQESNEVQQLEEMLKK